jgi:peptidyl-tRNA hydrolase ICT1
MYVWIALMLERVNSKATVRLPMKDLLPLVPNMLHQQIKESRFHAERSNALVIQADGSRKQGDNVEEAFRKLRDLITAAGKKSVRGESSPGQVQKAKNLYADLLALAGFYCKTPH